jgi:hypothetical protein
MKSGAKARSDMPVEFTRNDTLLALFGAPGDRPPVDDIDEAELKIR